MANLSLSLSRCVYLPFISFNSADLHMCRKPSERGKKARGGGQIKGATIDIGTSSGTERSTTNIERQVSSPLLPLNLHKIPLLSKP